MGLNTPLLIIVFNRPDKTKDLIKTLEKIKPKKLYVSADGPRIDSTKDKKLCNEVRELFKNINWDCDLKLKFSEKNLSCKKNVIDSINWLFSCEDEGIILEDDCVPSISFFGFCETLLEKYRNNNKVMQINGTNLDADYESLTKNSYFFSKFNHVWGWATWKRAWKLFDNKFENYEENKLNKKILNYFEDKNISDWMTRYFDAAFMGKDNIWSSHWAYTILNYNGLCATPSKNLVKNVGFDGSGTSGKSKLFNEYSNTRLEEIENIIHPDQIVYNFDFDKLVYYEKINKIDPRASKLNKIKSILKRFIRI